MLPFAAAVSLCERRRPTYLRQAFVVASVSTDYNNKHAAYIIRNKQAQLTVAKEPYGGGGSSDGRSCCDHVI